MEYQDNNNTDLFRQFSLDQIGRQHLRTMTKWARNIAIFSIVGYVVSFITLIIAPKKISTRSEGFEMPFAGMSSGSDLPYTIVSTIIGLVICMFLFRFASNVNKALDTTDQASLNNGFLNLKYYFIILSVFLIIVFVLIFLAIVAAGAMK